MNEHRFDDSHEYRCIPRNVKILMVFIDRIGFPIFAFILMTVISYHVLREITRTMVNINTTLVQMNTYLRESQEQRHDENRVIIDELKSLSKRG